MLDYRIYQHIRYKSRQSLRRGTARPRRDRTLRQLGIPLNRVNDMFDIPGIGGAGWAMTGKHVRTASHKMARSGCYGASFWCFAYLRRKKRYKCLHGPRTPHYRTRAKVNRGKR